MGGEGEIPPYSLGILKSKNCLRCKLMQKARKEYYIGIIESSLEDNVLSEGSCVGGTCRWRLHILRAYSAPSKKKYAQVSIVS